MSIGIPNFTPETLREDTRPSSSSSSHVRMASSSPVSAIHSEPAPTTHNTIATSSVPDPQNPTEDNIDTASLSRIETKNSIMRTFSYLLKEKENRNSAAAAARVRRLQEESTPLPTERSTDASAEKKKKKKKKKLRRWSTFSFRSSSPSSNDEEEHDHDVHAHPHDGKSHEIEDLTQKSSNGSSGSSNARGRRVSGYRDPYGRRMSAAGNTSTGIKLFLEDRERKQRMWIRRLTDHKWAPDFLH